MAELFNILKVTVAEDKICAHVLVNPGMPLMTSEDIEATARVYYLVPAIAKHLCLGDSGSEFQDCMGNTELCHLLEHVTVELMNETGLAGRIACGRTRVSEHDERVFEVEVSCPDDALTIGALSSATFLMNWAFLHADQPAPDVEGTVAGLRHLVLGMRAELEGTSIAGAEEAAEEGVAAAPAEPDGVEPVAAPVAVEAEPEPAPAEEGVSADVADDAFTAGATAVWDASALDSAVAAAPGAAVEPEPAAEPVSAAEPEPAAAPAGVPDFAAEPAAPIDTEGVAAEVHEDAGAVFGGAATVQPPHEAELPLVAGAFDVQPAAPVAPVAPVASTVPADPGATTAMSAQPEA